MRSGRHQGVAVLFEGRSIDVRAGESRRVRDEAALLPTGVPDRWRFGYPLRGVRTTCRGVFDTPAPGALQPGSLTAIAAGGPIDIPGTIIADEQWGTLATSDADLGTVELSYSYGLLRVDALVRDPGGMVILEGESHLTIPVPPVVATQFRHLANVFVPYFSDGSDAVLLPVGSPSGVLSRPTQCGLGFWNDALRAGRARVTCWGDSVTAGGSADSLETRFPDLLDGYLRSAGLPAQVTTVAVGGSTSAQWIGAQPPMPGTDWSAVEESRPDVVVAEFVNDAELPADQWPDLYAEILARCKALSADLVLCSPHYVRPDWMGLHDFGQPDPRPYVAFLSRFADQNDVSLAQVSRRWEALAGEGIAYITLLANGINHPDTRGHRIYAEEIAAVLGVTPARTPAGADDTERPTMLDLE